MRAVSIIAALSFLTIVFYALDSNLKRFYIFDIEKLQELAKASIERHPNNVTSLMSDLNLALREEYGSQHVLPFSTDESKWIWSTHGSAMGAFIILHASVTEYLIFYGTPVFSSGHSGLHMADDYFTILSGYEKGYFPGQLEATTYLPGDVNHLPRGKTIHYAMDGWALELAQAGERSKRREEQPSNPPNPSLSQPFVDENDPYHSSHPLPRYTPRPISLYEKTLVFEGRRSISDQPIPQDEKLPLDSSHNAEDDAPQTSEDQDHTSDTSSTFSYPSSYGNTSTATGETLPPPYSLSSSRAPSRRSMSIYSFSTHGPGMHPADILGTSPPPLIAIPPPAFHRDSDARGTRRDLNDSRNGNDPFLPPTLPSYSQL
ncbi:C-8 sterol isomerase [Myotisia sp. PD_48]|nr:C-8 sterol isomerase [Myotisia sp. PD_48]